MLPGYSLKRTCLPRQGEPSVLVMTSAFVLSQRAADAPRTLSCLPQQTHKLRKRVR